MCRVFIFSLLTFLLPSSVWACGGPIGISHDDIELGGPPLHSLPVYLDDDHCLSYHECNLGQLAVHWKAALLIFGSNTKFCSDGDETALKSAFLSESLPSLMFIFVVALVLLGYLVLRFRGNKRDNN